MVNAENVDCSQNEYSLENTISMGVVDNEIVQITNKLQIVKYPSRSYYYLTGYDGNGGPMANIYPKFSNLETFKMIQASNTTANFTFVVQKPLIKSDYEIIGLMWFYPQGSISYFFQRYDGNENVTEYRNRSNYLTNTINVIPVWTGNEGLKIVEIFDTEDENNLERITYWHRLYFVIQENNRQVVLARSERLDSVHGYICQMYDGTAIVMYKDPVKCSANLKWFKTLKFAFFLNNRIYFVSVIDRKIWSTSLEFMKDSDRPGTIREEDFDSLIVCVPSILNRATDNWLLTILIILLLIFLCCCLIYCCKKRKNIRKSGDNLKTTSDSISMSSSTSKKFVKTKFFVKSGKHIKKKAKFFGKTPKISKLEKDIGNLLR